MTFSRLRVRLDGLVPIGNQAECARYFVRRSPVVIVVGAVFGFLTWLFQSPGYSPHVFVNVAEWVVGLLIVLAVSAVARYRR
jgi:hypothetical protein